MKLMARLVLMALILPFSITKEKHQVLMKGNESYRLRQQGTEFNDETDRERRYGSGNLKFDTDGTIIVYKNVKFIDIPSISYQEALKFNNFKYKSEVKEVILGTIGNPQSVANGPYSFEISNEGKIEIKNKNKESIWQFEKNLVSEGPFVIMGAWYELPLYFHDDNWYLKHGQNKVEVPINPFGEYVSHRLSFNYFDIKYRNVPTEIKSKLLESLNDYINKISKIKGELPKGEVKEYSISNFAFTDSGVKYFHETKFEDFSRPKCDLIQQNPKYVTDYFDSYIKSEIKKLFDKAEEDKINLSIKNFCFTFSDYVYYYNAVLSTYYKDEKLYIYSIYTYLYSKNAVEQNMEYAGTLKVLTTYNEDKDRLDKEKRSQKEDGKVTIREHFKSVLSNEKSDEILKSTKRTVSTWDYYILESPKSDVKVIFDTFDKSRVNEIIEKYNFPDMIKEQLEILSFSKAGWDKKKLDFKQNSQNSVFINYEEILGIAVKDGENIFLAFGHSKCIGVFTKRKDSGDCVKKWMPRDQYYNDYNLLGYSKYWIREENGQIYANFCPRIAEKLNDEDTNIITRYFEALSSEGYIKKLDLMDICQTYTEKISIISKNKIYIAEVGEDGRIYVGSNARKNALFTNPLYTIGGQNDKSNGPYAVLINEKGNLFILNKSMTRVYSSKMLIQNGVAPFKLILTDDGTLKVADSKEQIVSDLRNN